MKMNKNWKAIAVILLGGEEAKNTGSEARENIMREKLVHIRKYRK